MLQKKLDPIPEKTAKHTKPFKVVTNVFQYLAYEKNLRKSLLTRKSFIIQVIPSFLDLQQQRRHKLQQHHNPPQKYSKPTKVLMTKLTKSLSQRVFKTFDFHVKYHPANMQQRQKFNKGSGGKKSNKYSAKSFFRFLHFPGLVALNAFLDADLTL